ncbi:hypothetical protein AGIG_G4226 [Arapaima gigas]
MATGSSRMGPSDGWVISASHQMLLWFTGITLERPLPVLFIPSQKPPWQHAATSQTDCGLWHDSSLSIHFLRGK